MEPKDDMFAVQGTMIYLCMRSKLFSQNGAGTWTPFDETRLPTGLAWKPLDPMTRNNWTDTLGANGLFD